MFARAISWPPDTRGTRAPARSARCIGLRLVGAEDLDEGKLREPELRFRNPDLEQRHRTGPARDQQCDTTVCAGYAPRYLSRREDPEVRLRRSFCRSCLGVLSMGLVHGIPRNVSARPVLAHSRTGHGAAQARRKIGAGSLMPRALTRANPLLGSSAQRPSWIGAELPSVTMVSRVEDAQRRVKIT